jgi:hypothetical protein
VLDYSDADLQSELDKVQGKQRQFEVDSKNGRSTNSHDDSVVERTHLESYRRDLETEVARRANGLHFESAGEAHTFAASVVEAMRSAELPTTTVSKETADGFRTRVRSIITESKSLDELEQKLMQWGSDFNFSRSSSPAEAKLQIEALSQELPSITEMARALGTQPHEVTAMLARSITRHLDAGQAVAMAKKMFGDTKDLPQRLLATRGWLYAKGAEVSRLSKMVDGAPTNAVAMHELTETLDQLWDFHAAASGTASNVGRTLDALKIDPQPLVSQIEQQTTDSEGQQAARQASDVLEAKATGKTPGQQAEEAAAKAETNGKTPKAPKAPRQTTPEQAAVRQAAEDALQDLKRARADMVNKRFDKDTPHSAAGNDAPNATDMSLSRARMKAKAAIAAAQKQGFEVHEGPVSPEIAAYGEERSLTINEEAAAQRENPLTAPETNGVKQPPKNPMDELSKTLDLEERQLESILNPEPKVQGPKEHNDPVRDYIKLNGRSPGTRLSSGLTKKELRGLARQIRLAEGDPDKILDALYATRATKVAKGDPTLMQKIIGFRMNSMLSGPKTLVINAASNAMAALQRPVEFWYAGVRSGNKELRSMGSDVMVGLATELGDSFRAGWKSFVAGENMLDLSKKAFEDRTAEMASKDGKTWLQTLLNGPSRVLMSTDEFFKQLNYRSNVRAQALRDARELGMTEPKDIADHVESTLQSAFALKDQDGFRYRSATNPVALQYARVSTFTNELGEGTMGKWLQDGAIKHPFVRLVMPFVRTPVNLFRWTWERTPGLGRFSESYQQAMKAGGEQAAVAKAKIELGTAMYGAAAFYALTGNITGAGPSNPVLRQQWLQAGNEPYSIKVPGTNTWISYRRADPVVTPVGLAATAMDNVKESGEKIASATRIRNMQREDGDIGGTLGLIADFVHASGEIAEEDGTRMATAFIASIAANVSSKTFLQGMVEFMDGLSGGEPFKVQTFLTNMATSFIPNIIRQTNPDDTVRETRGIFDEIVSRTPWSAGLEPKRNLFGEPVLRAPGYINRTLNPFTVTQKSDDPTVADQLVSLGRGMTMPAEERLGGAVRLTDRTKWSEGAAPERQNQSPYDRMLEIMANPGNGTPSLKQAMTKLVTSKPWGKISDGTAAQPGGEKYKLAATIIGQYQDIALARVKGEYPALQRALSTEDAQRAAAALQGEAGVAAVQKLFQPR